MLLLPITITAGRQRQLRALACIKGTRGIRCLHLCASACVLASCCLRSASWEARDSALLLAASSAARNLACAGKAAKARVGRISTEKETNAQMVAAMAIAMIAGVTGGDM